MRHFMNKPQCEPWMNEGCMLILKINKLANGESNMYISINKCEALKNSYNVVWDIKENPI